MSFKKLLLNETDTFINEEFIAGQKVDTKRLMKQISKIGKKLRKDDSFIDYVFDTIEDSDLDGAFKRGIQNAVDDTLFSSEKYNSIKKGLEDAYRMHGTEPSAAVDYAEMILSKIIRKIKA